MREISDENQEQRDGRMDQEVRFDKHWQLPSSFRTAQQTTQDSVVHGRSIANGDCQVQGFGCASDGSARSLEKEVHEYGSQLEQEDTLSSIARQVVAKFPNAKTSRNGKYALLINLGKGAKWQVHFGKARILKLQLNGDRPVRYEAAELLVADLHASSQPDRISSDVNQAALHQLLSEQDGRCALTGRNLTPENVELDHRQPRSKGGEHSLSNVQLVVIEANRAKGNMDLEAFVLLCNDVARMHPRPDTAQEPYRLAGQTLTTPQGVPRLDGSFPPV
jgi:hypothetical protein